MGKFVLESSVWHLVVCMLAFSQTSLSVKGVFPELLCDLFIFLLFCVYT